MPKRRAASQEATIVSHPPRPSGDPSDIASHGPCPVSHIFELVTKKRNGKVFLSKDSFPSYTQDDIWAILQDCGFKFLQGCFRYKGIPNFPPIAHEDDVRRKLAVIGLPPNVEEEVSDDDDLPTLQRWVAFANVPLKESDAARVLETLPLPSDYQALVWLGKLGYKVDGETKQIYRIRSDGVMEEYDSINQLRVFVRQADNESLLATATSAPGGGGGGGGDASPSPARKRSRRATRTKDVLLSDDDMLALRLWGALAPSPLPAFGEEFRVEDYNKNGLDSAAMEIDTISGDKDEAQKTSTATKDSTSCPVATTRKDKVASKTKSSSSEGSGDNKVKPEEAVLSSSSKSEKEEAKIDRNNGPKVLEEVVTASPLPAQDTMVDEPTTSEDRSEEETPAPVASTETTQSLFQGQMSVSAQNAVDYSDDQHTKNRPQMEMAQAPQQQGSESSCIIL